MNDSNTDILINKIQVIMNRKGITRIDLAKRVNISNQTLGRYLLKQRTMPFEVGVLIAKELDIDLNSLFELKENPFNEDEYLEYLKFKELFNKKR